MEELDLYALKYFFDTIELTSMTEAAAANYVTRSAVSQAITRLEAWAGLSLLKHEKRTVRLTDSGERFYRNMKKAYETFAAALEIDQDERSLSIGCSASLTDGFLLPYLKGVRPLEKLNVVTGTTSELAHKLETGEIHIAISIGGGGQILSSGHFVVASPSGKLTDQIIVTERRPEVSALRRVLPRRHTYLTVESWTLAAKIARELGCAVLLPDFLLSDRLSKVDVRGFKPRFNVTLKTAPRHLLSKSEIEFLSTMV